MRAFRARRRERGHREQELRARAEAAEDQAQAYRDVLTALADGGIPPELAAAAQDAPHGGQAVRTVIDGREVIVVVGDEGGSPAQWMAAISADLRRRHAS